MKPLQLNCRRTSEIRKSQFTRCLSLSRDRFVFFPRLIIIFPEINLCNLGKKYLKSREKRLKSRENM